MRGYLIASFLVAACEAATAHGGGAAEWAAFGEPGKPSAVTRTIAITARDMRYSTKFLAVKTGETIRFVITNKGPSKHEFVLGTRAFHQRHIKEMEAMPDMEMDDANSVDVTPGQVKSVVWRFTRPGDYVFGCDMPGHFQAGMFGTIAVR